MFKKTVSILIATVLCVTFLNGIIKQKEYKVYIDETGKIIREGQKPPTLSELLPLIEKTRLRINTDEIYKAIAIHENTYRNAKFMASQTDDKWGIVEGFTKIWAKLNIGTLYIFLTVCYPINAILTLTQLVYLILVL